ncbi:uridine monophosphate kinase [bacterium]|nr:uridine monophosphate kinase [candidate division CSSED10-310 bacterium]
MMPIYHRVLLKISGELLQGDGDPIDAGAIVRVTGEISEARRLGVQLGIVIGGGNILRGATTELPGVRRLQADRAGMLATVVNSLLVAESLRAAGIPTLIQSALGAGPCEEAIDPARADAALTAGSVVLFAGGTGNPYFSTDSAAALRALEINAAALLKGTKVRGLFDKDPVLHEKAVFIPHARFDTVIAEKYRVMDLTAFSLCRSQSLPIRLFQMTIPGNLARLLRGDQIGTLVDGGEEHA